MSKDVSIKALAESMKDVTGAELINFCQEAVMFSLRDNIHQICVTKEHFDKAHELFTGSFINQTKHTVKPKEDTFSFSFSWNANVNKTE